MSAKYNYPKHGNAANRVRKDPGGYKTWPRLLFPVCLGLGFALSCIRVCLLADVFFVVFSSNLWTPTTTIAAAAGAFCEAIATSRIHCLEVWIRTDRVYWLRCLCVFVF